MFNKKISKEAHISFITENKEALYRVAFGYLAFANAIAELPLIGNLAEYVKLDKSLSKAIENEHVQEVNLVAWDGNNRLLLPYVIADEKKLVLFFQMPEEFITVDIDNKTITPNIEGMELKQVIRETDNATLVFLTHRLKDDNFGMFNHDYEDVDGNKYRLDGEGTSSYNSHMETLIPVKYPHTGKVILQRSLSPKIFLERPLKIELPVSN